MNTHIIGPSWAPKLGGLISIIGIGIGKHPMQEVAWWSEIVTAIGVAIMSWSTRQNGVSSEQVAEAKLPSAPKVGMLWLLAGLLLLPGCTAPILPGNDHVIVRAEQARDVAVSTFDTFVVLEYRNREILKTLSSNFYPLAERIRTDSDGWIKSLEKVLKTYKATRTPEGQSGLISAIAVLESSLAEVQSHIAIATHGGVTQ
ncbi:MAG: hypothetical protein ABL994_16715 [Verrucomicrobiales bacterium]